MQKPKNTGCGRPTNHQPAPAQYPLHSRRHYYSADDRAKHDGGPLYKAAALFRLQRQKLGDVVDHLLAVAHKEERRDGYDEHEEEYLQYTFENLARYRAQEARDELRAVLHDGIENRELRYKVELMHEAAENRDILYHEYDVLVRTGDEAALHNVAAYPNPLARHEHREQEQRNGDKYQNYARADGGGYIPVLLAEKPAVHKFIERVREVRKQNRPYKRYRERLDDVPRDDDEEKEQKNEGDDARAYLLYRKHISFIGHREVPPQTSDGRGGPLQTFIYV